MAEYKHLTPSAISALDWNQNERILFVQKDRWIGYPQAHAILDRMERLFNHPIVTRMPNLLIVGESNSGKTTLARRFVTSKNPRNDPGAEHADLPVLMIRTPPEPDEHRLYHYLLEHLRAPHKDSSRVDRKLFQIVKILQRIGIKLLILDELQHALAGGTIRQRQYLNALKNLGEELQIPIVAIGVFDSLNVLQTDSQLSNRFPPVVLNRWEMNTDFARLLASFEANFPLPKPSNLASDETAAWLLVMSQGLLGELCTLLKLAAETAIRANEPQISLELLKSLHWVPPSNRRQSAERSFLFGAPNASGN